MSRGSLSSLNKEKKRLSEFYLKLEETFSSSFELKGHTSVATPHSVEDMVQRFGLPSTDANLGFILVADYSNIQTYKLSYCS